MRPVRLLFALVFTFALTAQDPAWGLPERGAAKYERTIRCTSDTAKKKKQARDLECKGKIPQAFLARLAPVPWLCEGELRADKLALRSTPRELRDLLRFVAFDLSLGSRPRLEIPRFAPFGDLILTGRQTAARDGTQTYELKIKHRVPEARKHEKKARYRRYIVPTAKHEAEGTLTLSRRFDAQRGVVESFSGTLALWFEEKKNVWRKIVIEDEWKLAELHENQDAWFRGAVAKAIHSGRDWLKKELGKLDRRHLKDGKDRSYGSGRIALGLLTMLHAEVPADDPVIAKGFAELARREIVDTYSLGIALMAMSAKYAPPGEVQLVRSGTLKGPKLRELSATDKELAGEWLQQLRQNIDIRVDPAYLLRFNYVRGRRWDNSVNQYGLLGLHSAALCQLEVPVTLWRAAANHLLQVQCVEEGTRRSAITTYAEQRARSTAGKKGTRSSPRKIPVRGYTYYGPDYQPAYGSMTTAGLTGLVLSRAGLHRAGLDKADLMDDLVGAIDSSFAWMDANFDVRSNPGFVGRAHTNWYYYLYGLERACELAGVKLVGGRDWYYEGALQILSHQQKKGGAWPIDRNGAYKIDATCFSILFLKKATLPVITSK